MYLINSLATFVIVVILPRQAHVFAAQTVAPTYLFQMKGTAIAEMRPNPIDPTQELPCFDIPLHDLVTGDVVGMGTDCLSVAEDQESCNGLEVTATTVFTLDQGSITLQGLTSVQPTTFGSSESTHITGAITQDGDNSIVSGDGIYENASGSVRLSGAVNMANLESKGEVTFDCLWVVYLDNPMDDLLGDGTDMVVSQAVKATADDMTQRLVLQMKGTAAAEMRPNPLDESQTLPCCSMYPSSTLLPEKSWVLELTASPWPVQTIAVDFRLPPLLSSSLIQTIPSLLQAKLLFSPRHSARLTPRTSQAPFPAPAKKTLRTVQVFTPTPLVPSACPVPSTWPTSRAKERLHSIASG